MLLQTDNDFDWDEPNKQSKSTYPNSVGPLTQGSFNPGSESSNQNPWAQLRQRQKKSPFSWGGANYNAGGSLFSASRGRFDYDAQPSNSTRFPDLAEWGDREQDRRQSGYFSAAYDPGYSVFYSPQVETTSYSPFFSESAPTYYNPYQSITY